MSTERQIEANRRNAQKSTGPRTADGKERSRLNAVTHGMTAQFDALPGEEAAALAGRIDAWTADLGPRNQLEYDLIERAARASWQLDMVELAEVARITANILKATSGENAAAEIEAARELGARLLGDSPKPDITPPGIGCDPIGSARILLNLESSAAGCRWLLDRWAELRSKLEQGQAWQSPDKLTAIRLLGRQPLDALDGTQVAGLFLACHTIDSSGGELFHEIEDTLTPEHWKLAKELLAKRPFEWLRPRDQAEAREALFQIVDRAVQRLETKADVHRQRDERDVATAPARLAVDTSRKGELLRNYAAKCQRALFRALDDFIKVRRGGNTGKAVPAAVALKASTEPVAPIDQRITQNEPNFGAIVNTITDSVAPLDHGITQNEPNFETTKNPNADSVAPLDQRITQNEPNFGDIENTITDSVAPLDHGITQNEPNFGDIENTITDSVVRVDHGITQNEPNFVSTRNTKEISQANHKTRVNFREDRAPRASPRTRYRRAHRIHQRRPLRTAGPAGAFCAGRRSRAGPSPRDRPKGMSPGFVPTGRRQPIALCRLSDD